MNKECHVIILYSVIFYSAAMASTALTSLKVVKCVKVIGRGGSCMVSAAPSKWGVSYLYSPLSCISLMA